MKALMIILLPALGCAASPDIEPTTDGSAPVSAARAGALDSALQVTSMDGAEVDLRADLEAGSPVALVFWQSWCQSCLREAPGIAAAHRALGDRIRFVGVISGPDKDVDEDAIRGVVDRLDLEYLHVSDRDLSLTRLFDVRATPTIVVLDAEGRVAYQDHQSPESWEAFLTPRSK